MTAMNSDGLMALGLETLFPDSLVLSLQDVSKCLKIQSLSLFTDLICEQSDHILHGKL